MGSMREEEPRGGNQVIFLRESGEGKPKVILRQKIFFCLLWAGKTK